MRTVTIILFILFFTVNLLPGQREDRQVNIDDTTDVENKSYDTLPRPDTIIYSWRYAQNSFVKLYADFDTTLMQVQQPEIYKTKWPGYIYLGNLGSAVQNISFYERQNINLHWQIQNYYPYLRTRQNQIFYNTKAPFTQLHYVSASEDWEYFTFNHTQNYNKHINLGISFEVFQSQGYLIFQETKNRNFGFWTDINYNRYKMYGSINFNNINVNENGGITSDYLMSDSSLSLQDINVKLSNSSNLYSHFNGALNQQLNILALGDDSLSQKGLWLSHHFKFNKMQHLYQDDETYYTNPLNEQQVQFYNHTYSGVNSNDTTSNIDYKNRLAFSYQGGNKTKFEAGPFIEHHQKKITNLFRDTLFNYYNDTSYQTLSTGGQISLKKSNDFDINIQGYYYPFEGFDYNNYQITGNFVKWLTLERDTLYIHLQVKHQEHKPAYLLRKYYSNHFKWVNKFQDINERKLLLNIRMLKARTNFSFTANHIENYIYFGENMKPAQHQKEIMVFGSRLNQKLTFFKKIHIELDILGQYTATKFIDIPDFNAKANFYYTHTFHFNNTGGKLKMYTGLSGRFHTKYYAPAYNPAIGQFYLQHERLIGNYPVIDLFAGARIKRFLFFLRVEHINSGIRGTSYYSAYNYPIRPRNFKFGVSWNFYN